MKNYNGWEIEKVGGFSTIKRYIASKDDRWHWAFLLRECRELCDERDNGNKISELYLRPLYN